MPARFAAYKRAAPKKDPNPAAVKRVCRQGPCFTNLPSTLIGQLLGSLPRYDAKQALDACRSWHGIPVARPVLDYAVWTTTKNWQHHVLDTCIPKKVRHVPFLYTTDDTFQRVVEAFPKLEGLGFSSEISAVILRDLPPTLTKLDLTTCHKVDDNHMPLIAKLPLQWLGLSSIKVTDLGFAHFCSFAATLQHLNVAYSHITDAGMVHLTALSLLKFLNVSSCHRLTDAGLQLVSTLPSLRTLLMASLSRVDGTAFPAIGAMPLEVLDVQRNRSIDAAALSALCAAGTITNLNVSCCSSLTELPPLPPTLTRLCLHVCTALGRGAFKPLAELPHLTNLDIGGCTPTTEDYADLKGTWVRHLDIGGSSNLNPQRLKNISEMPHVQSVNMAGCANVTKSGLGNLRNLKELILPTRLNVREVNKMFVGHQVQVVFR